MIKESFLNLQTKQVENRTDYHQNRYINKNVRNKMTTFVV